MQTMIVRYLLFHRSKVAIRDNSYIMEMSAVDPRSDRRCIALDMLFVANNLTKIFKVHHFLSDI